MYSRIVSGSFLLLFSSSLTRVIQVLCHAMLRHERMPVVLAGGGKNYSANTATRQDRWHTTAGVFLVVALHIKPHITDSAGRRS